MEYASFLERLIGELQERLGERHKLEGRVIRGLNGTERHALMVMGGDAATIPCFHLDKYYKDYLSGRVSISKAAQEIAARYLEDGHKAGVDEEILYQEAWKRINAEEAYFCSMADIFATLSLDMSLSGQSLQEMAPMYILSNKKMLNGAVEICSPKALQEAARHIGGDFWVLLSSIHEAILLPCCRHSDEVAQIAAIVKSINKSEVSPDEILSDHVYHYCMEDGGLEIAG